MSTRLIMAPLRSPVAMTLSPSSVRDRALSKTLVPGTPKLLAAETISGQSETKFLAFSGDENMASRLRWGCAAVESDAVTAFGGTKSGNPRPRRMPSIPWSMKKSVGALTESDSAMPPKACRKV